MNIMAVDDERAPLQLLEESILEAVPGCHLAGFLKTGEALDYAKSTKIDVVFADVEMPGMSGLVFAQNIREICATTNIVFVTGFVKYSLDALKAHVSGFIEKPVSARAIRHEMDNLRHPPRRHKAPPGAIGPFVFDHQSLKVWREGQDMLLVPREYALFRLLAENPGQYFTAEALYALVWGQAPNSDVRTIYPHMSRLRKKLGLDHCAELHIEQKRGSGYRLVLSGAAQP